jgi:hypothetical protein
LNDAPDVLLDGSGLRRHLYQPLLSSRPKFRQEFNGAMLSFDGTNDFLALSGGNASSAETTVFVVAARSPMPDTFARSLVSMRLARMITLPA